MTCIIDPCVVEINFEVAVECDVSYVGLMDGESRLVESKRCVVCNAVAVVVKVSVSIELHDLLSEVEE